MNRHTQNPFRSLLGFTILVGLAASAAAAPDVRLAESYGKLPLQFEANQGQTDPAVRFLSRGPGYSLYLTAGEAVLMLAKPKTQDSVALRMNLVGAARKPQVNGAEELPGKVNYFIGRDRSKWRTNVPTYAKVHYRDVYPGIDLVYYGSQRQLEYDFVVAPGVDPKKIVLGFKGAEKLEIDAQGDLVLRATGGDIRQHKPVVYQEINGVKREIEGSYVRKGANRVGFQIAAYDRGHPLVIDPVVLSYSTYLGSNDQGFAIAVDLSGNAYVTGITNSTRLPTGSDAFVTKLNAEGSALVYSTYLGGSDSDSGAGIAVDAAGNAYVTGTTESTDFPTTLGAFQPIFGGGSISGRSKPSDAFVTKIDAAGSTLIYSTFLGGLGNDNASGIAVDASGNAYVAGSTTCAQGISTTLTTPCANNFPTTPGAFEPVFTGGSAGFVTKLNPSGSFPIYSTFLGGAVRAIALDSDGNAYLSTQLVPPTPGAFQTTPGDSNNADASVTKLNAAGSALVYSTLLGGSGSDSVNAIAVDAARNVYVTGGTNSPDFPTTPGAFQPTSGGGNSSNGDAFVTKLDPTGSALVYSTYLGGSSPDVGAGIAVDAAGNAYLTGVTISTDFPVTADAFQAISDGTSYDAYVTVLNPTGSALVYSTYLGGSGVDLGSGIAVDAGGNAYVTGDTGPDPFASTQNPFPTTAGSFQPVFAGGLVDAFVAKFAGFVAAAPATTGF